MTPSPPAGEGRGEGEAASGRDHFVSNEVQTDDAWALPLLEVAANRVAAFIALDA